MNVVWLASKLEAQGHRVVRAREPGGTALGEGIRPLLLHAESPPTARAALLLFEAARAELVDRVLRPSLAAGAVVICDRFTDSTLAYQGYGDGLPLPEIELANTLATQGLSPDVTILLDIDPAIGLRRRRHSTEWNVMDARSLEYHRRVRRGFQELAAQQPARWLVLDATRPLAILRSKILERIDAQLVC